MTLFGLLMDASAAEENEYPLGSRHHLLVFVRAPSEEGAIAEALLALADGRWRDGELKQIQPFGVAPASIADPVVRDAAMKAEQGHRSVIVYDQP